MAAFAFSNVSLVRISGGPSGGAGGSDGERNPAMLPSEIAAEPRTCRMGAPSPSPAPARVGGGSSACQGALAALVAISAAAVSAAICSVPETQSWHDLTAIPRPAERNRSSCAAVLAAAAPKRHEYEPPSCTRS